MNPRDLVTETLRSLRAHALRFALTGLGIAWGALMLTYLVASMSGTARHYERQLEAGGERALYVFPGAILKERVGERGSRPVEIEEEDLARLRSLHHLEHVSPNVTMWNRLVRAGRRIVLLNVTGAGADLVHIRNFTLAEGRFFSPVEVDRHAHVAVLSPGSKERLFGRRRALGRTIHVDGVRFRVIGVTARKGQIIGFGGRDDHQTFVPWTTAQRWITRREPLRQIVAAPPDVERTRGAIDAVRMLLGLHHHFEPSSETALHFASAQEIWSLLDRIFTGLRIFLFATGLVTLLVGAVGVMNLMLVVVGERRREIGLRKALGARDRDVFRLFLAEAVAVSVASGALGTLLGVGLVQLQARSTSPDDPMFAAPLLDPWIAAAVGSSLVLVAVVSGVVPAWRAARTPPAESLRAGA